MEVLIIVFFVVVAILALILVHIHEHNNRPRPSLHDIVTEMLRVRHKEVAKNVMQGNAIIHKLDPHLLMRWYSYHVRVNHKAHTKISTLYAHYAKYAGDRASDRQKFAEHLMPLRPHTRNGRVLRTQLIK